MADRCKICRETKEPALSTEEEELADMLYDNLSNEADEEGPGILSDIEFDFICGAICKKCFLSEYRKTEGLYE
jgi:hypothetical protein